MSRCLCLCRRIKMVKRDASTRQKKINSAVRTQLIKHGLFVAVLFLNDFSDMHFLFNIPFLCRGQARSFPCSARYLLSSGGHPKDGWVLVCSPQHSLDTWLVLSCLVLSCLVLSCLVLSSLALSSLALSCLFLLST